MIQQSLRTVAANVEEPGRQALNDIPALLCLIGSDGRLRWTNSAWSQLLGYNRETLIGTPFARFFHPADIPLFESGLRTCGPTSSWQSFEARFRSADETYNWLQWQFNTDPIQSVVHAIAIDVSGRKEAESVVRRRLAAASLQAQLWMTCAESGSGDELLRKWSELLRRELEADEVRIWTPNGLRGALILKARSLKQAAFGGTLSSGDILQGMAAQVATSRAPRLIPDVGLAPDLSAYLGFLREERIEAAILYPLVSAERVLAVIAAFFRMTYGSSEKLVIEVAVREMGVALARRNREEELRDSKRAHDALTRSVSAGVCSLDLHRHITAWNAAAEKILGWRPTDVLGTHLPIAGAAEREHWETCLSGAFAGKSTSRIETKILSADGTAVDTSLSISPLAGPDAAVENALVVFEDLTDRKRAERRMRLLQTLTKLLAGSRPVAEAMSAVLGAIGRELGCEYAEFWLVDPVLGVPQRKSSWHASTPQAEKFDRESQDGPVEGGDPVGGLLAVDAPRRLRGISRDRRFARACLAAECGLDDAFGFPVRVRNDPTAALVFFASEINEPDEPLMAVVAAISEEIAQFLDRCQMQESLRAAEENLLQTSKMDAVGRLVGGVVHDFNNVLTVILGYGEIVLEEGGSSGANHELLAEVVDSGKRAAALTRQLLAFCRKEVAEPVVLDLNARVEEMSKMLGRLVGENIELETVLAPDLDGVSADPAHLEQVVMNLVVNARDAMPHGGKLIIETQPVDLDATWLKTFPRAPAGRYVHLSVGDNGTGMDEATRRRIFEPFFTTKPSGKGTGMGLATVAEIVGQYDGHIAVESRPGAGTTFRILFPAIAKTLACWQVDQAPATLPRGNETVLVVEDDPRVRRLIAHVLKAQGYRILEAADGQEALDLCGTSSAPIDLVIADVVMPKMSGPQLAERLKPVNSAIRVLFVSGYGEGNDRAAMEIRRAGSFLQKPFTSYDLARKVRDACNSRD